jgi:hypothetical protein
MAKKLEYAEAETPCIVVRKPCGCYVAACGLDDSELREIVNWNISSYIDMPSVIRFLKEFEPVAEFELRPVSFVRSGGLNFSCDHVEAQTVRP